MTDIVKDIKLLILQRLDEADAGYIDTGVAKKREQLLTETAEILESVGRSDLVAELDRALKDYEFRIYTHIYIQALKDSISLQKNLLS